MKAAPGFELERCPNCLGQKVRTPLCPPPPEGCGGKTTVVNPKGAGYQRLKCRTCKGKGRIKKQCWQCFGGGKIQVKI